MALAKGPQREPMTVISLTTMGQVSTGAAPWKVDFKTSVPRGSVICWASVRPVGEPVASMTSGNVLLDAFVVARIAGHQPGFDFGATRQR